MAEDYQNMPLVGHLRELRRRFMIALLAVGVAFLLTYTWSAELYSFLAKPLLSNLPNEHRFITFTGVGEPFFVYLKIAFGAAVMISSPVVLYQMWAFVAPGLYRDEKLWFGALVAFSLALFSAGSVFAYKVIFPFGFKYLLSFSTPELVPFISMDLYLSLAAKTIIAFGAAFELPLLMLVLARLGVVDARMLLYYWRYAVIGIFVVGAIFTPPDVFSQLLLSVPLLILYAMGVILALIFGKKKKAEGA
ncbi:MAG: twin-arginine translocase subunit TatC [Deltaproteobacteria bacterium]|nr:twin-arginine translocase subunit TatC [Deltaproteobacteria bacterium]